VKVSIQRTDPRYPEPPFSPGEPYPEYPLPAATLARQPNGVYSAVRQCLRRLGFDAANFGSPAWNPLGHLIGPGARVILKPNFVNDFNPLGDEPAFFQALVTQAAVMRAVVDYVLIATGGACRLTVADLPIQSADFPSLCRKTGLTDLIDFMAAEGPARADVQLLDLRDFFLQTDRDGAVLGRLAQPGDPEGYVTVDLGPASSLTALQQDAHLFRVGSYDHENTVAMHAGGRHGYVLPRTVLQSDLFINLPKLKVHRKVGVTLCLKNLVGIIGDKSCLPHYRAGSPEDHGDEYPVRTAVNVLHSRFDFPLRRRGRAVWRLVHPLGHTLVRMNKLLHRRDPLAQIVAGDWYGNDTAWRMVHDLNRIAVHADAGGVLHDEPQRRYLAFVDGVIGGEGEGPLKPHPVPSGLVVAGEDPLAVDIVCSRLMGLDWRKIPQLSRFDPDDRFPFSRFAGDPDGIDIAWGDGEGASDTHRLSGLSPVHDFHPPAGWAGHCEL
jgi:uncharacterized protein (DUF362 family)